MPWIPMRDGQKVFVRIIGKGRPTLFLHGFGMHSAHWLPFLLPLAHRYKFYLPDMRGFGESGQIRHNKPCVLTNYAEDLADIIDYFRLENFPLAGISMGAFISMQYFRTVPDPKVSAYLNIDQSPHIRCEGNWHYGLFGVDGIARFKLLEELYEGAKAFGPDTPFQHLPKDFQQAFLHELGDFIGYAFSKPLQKRWVKELWRFPSLADKVLPARQWFAYATCIGAYLTQDYDMRASLKTLEMPVWVLAGLKSDMYPWQGQKFIADQCRQGHFLPFEKSGHIPMLDEPRRFVQVANGFIRSH